MEHIQMCSSIEPNNMTPDLRLWVAVLWRSLQDYECIYISSCYTVEQYRHARAAYKWLRDKDRCIGSFRWICDHIVSSDNNGSWDEVASCMTSYGDPVERYRSCPPVTVC